MTVINGNDDPNILTGDVGGIPDDDIIHGLGGDDALFGLSGDDTLYGDDGNDSLSGGSGKDTLYGGDSSDALFGGSGADKVHGAGGDDFIAGDSGADLLDGGSGADSISYLLSGAGVTVDLAAGTGDGGDAEGDTYQSIEIVAGSNHDDLITGNSANNLLGGAEGDDALAGGSGSDILTGDDGADSLNGGSGTDYLIGGDGADTINGGKGTDTIVYGDSLSGVEIDLAAQTAEGGTAEGDSFTAVENVAGSAFDDSLSGDGKANVLGGGVGEDQLTGRGGDDTLYGGLNSDHMNGGAGDDTFVYAALFESKGSGADIIAGFTVGEDQIDVSVIDTDFGTNGDQDFTFIGNSTFTGAGDEIRFQTGGGDTLVLADIDGDSQADFKIVLNGEMTLTAGEFIL